MGLTVINFPKSQEKQMQSGVNVVESIEKALELAKSGEFTNIVIIATTHNGSVGHLWANGNDAVLMVGAIAVTQQDFLQDCIE